MARRSIYPYVVSSLIATGYVAPYEANGEFGFVAMTLKILPILYLISYVNSYIAEIDAATKARRGNKSRDAHKSWKARRHLAGAILNGLACSAIGDIAILLRLKSDLCFVFGTIAFGIAHAFYIYGMGFLPASKVLGAALFVIAVVTSTIMFRDASSPLNGVLSLYAGILAMCLWRAIDRSRRDDGRSEAQKSLLVTGLCFFVASDTWIGVSSFHLQHPSPASVQFILLTYYVAQGLIVLSVT